MTTPGDPAGAREGAGPFVSRLHARMAALDTRVCLSVAPRPERHPATDPAAHDHDPAKVARAVVVHYREAITAAAAHLACLSLTSAAFERMGIPGLIAMAQLIADAREHGIPCILDARRGGPADVATAYADAYLGDGVFAADALTVNPWAGMDGIEAFLAAAVRSDRGVFVVVRGPGAGAGDLQDLRTEVGTVAERLADLLSERAREAGVDAHGYGPLGAVVGADDPARLAALRARLPHAPLLVPAGPAGAAPAEAAAAAFDADGFGAVVATGRDLLAVGDGDTPRRVAEATRAMKEALNAAIAAR